MGRERFEQDPLHGLRGDGRVTIEIEIPRVLVWWLGGILIGGAIGTGIVLLAVGYPSGGWPLLGGAGGALLTAVRAIVAL